MSVPNCSCCAHFALVQKNEKPNGVMVRIISTTGGESWCGWSGGFPQPGNLKTCNPKSRVIPHGLAIGASGRVIAHYQIPSEAESYKDVMGNG